MTDVHPPSDSDCVDLVWRPVSDGDRAFATTPREIQETPVDDPARVSYCYWLSLTPNKTWPQGPAAPDRLRSLINRRRNNRISW